MVQCATLRPLHTHILKRIIPESRDGVSNTFFIRTLFTDGALHAFLSLYRPGKGRKREASKDIFTGNVPLPDSPRSSDTDAEAQRQRAKEEKVYDV
jgi:hypothetical protein